MHWGRRWLYLTHRWIGILSCLFFAVWFMSGLVMMYVPFPSLTASERLDHLEPLDWRKIRVGPERALAAAGQNGFPARLTLVSIGADPAWRIRGRDDVDRTISAATGQPIAPVSAEQASSIARRFAHGPAAASVTMIERDQWTVAGGFDRWRPLYRVDLADRAGTRLYLASANGEVVLDTTRAERFWNWLGSVPHWLYPTVLRKDQPLWRHVVLWTSGICIVSAVSGMWIGILRLRVRRRYKQDRISPYRGWHWWHHMFGLVGGSLLTTWIVSGWLSVDPNRWFASPGLSDQARAAYANVGTLPPFDASVLAARPDLAKAKRMRVAWVDGRALLIFEWPEWPPVVLDARTLQRAAFTPGALAQAARRAVPTASPPAMTTLIAPDAYWYEAKGSVELPMLRFAFDDSAGTWLHVSPRTGEIVGESDVRRRVYRWLFDGLHRWDFNGLITRRPLWDVWMSFWSLAGIVLSTSGIVIGYRRLVRPVTPRRRGSLPGAT